MIGTLGIALLAGCATGPGASPKDPWEAYNRDMTKFNEAVDGAVLKPAATAYKNATAVVRTGFEQFLWQSTQLWTALNGALQLKGQVAAESFVRFNVNFFFGFGGVLDIASEIHLERYRKILARRWGGGACQPVRTLYYPSMGHQPCGMHWPLASSRRLT